MSIPPSQNRCERKLKEIEDLKQKDNHSVNEVEKINTEDYYKNALKQFYKKEVASDPIYLAEAHPVCDHPISIDENHIMLRCNYGKDVYKYIVTGKKYVIEMPNINTILNVTCTFAACRAADMHINTATVNGQRDRSSETCTISYNYDNFDSIYYTSFRSPDACVIYCQ